MFWLGLGLTGAFVIRRTINVYGDPIPWDTQESPVFTVLLLWTGVVLALYLLCPWFAAVKQRRSDPLLSYL